MKKQSNISPSVVLSTLSALWSSNTSLAQISSTMDERMQRGISFRNVFLEITIGAKSAVQPTIISVLNILLPTTFPIAMSALPFRADDTLTVSSGAEVPKATMVRPMTMDGMRKRLAMDAAPSVRPLAPKRMRRRPPIRKRISIKILIWMQI